jgi:hypothetical protein
MFKLNLPIGAIVLAVAGVMASCHVEPDENCEYGFREAVIVYSGAPEVDGCGWMVLIDSVAYHPVDLGIDYQMSDLPVLIKYVLDPEVFRCGRGGAVYPAIRITDIKKNTAELLFLKDNEWDKYSLDAFRLDSAYVHGDNLMMQVGYSGGCRDHEFILWKLPPNALNPPPIELALSHQANGDMCEAYITRWLSFSLVPLRERGKSEITFLLRGSPEMSSYFGEFIYKY